MSLRSQEVMDKIIAVAERGETVMPVSKIPPLLRFPLIVVLSLAFSSLSYSLISEYTAGELARVSTSLDQWWEVSGLIIFKTFELALGWLGDYDGYDLAAMSLLSHGPSLYLLGTFYEIRTTTVISSLIIDILATYLPFRLLRPLSLAHSASTTSRSVVFPNKEIVTDVSIQTFTTFLAASIYSVTLYTAYASYLPVYLVTYFSDIPSIVACHTATPITLLPITLALGLASKSFIFTPAAAASPYLAGVRSRAFNPATASLSETFWWNLWGYSARTKVVIKRTLTLVFISGVNTFVQTFVTIEGVDATGAAAYSAIWAVAAGITGIALGVVGSV